MLSVLNVSSLPDSNPVLWAIGISSLLLWGLIIQSYWRIYQLRKASIAQQFLSQGGGYLPLAPSLVGMLHLRWRSEVKLYLGQGGNEMKLLIRLLPMLGLLGTVDGMVDCFANLTQSNVLEAVSSGISQAMLTTLAGLLAALSGMYFSYHLQRQQQSFIRQFTHELETHEDKNIR